MIFPWILIAVFILLIILGVVATYITSKSKKKHKPDYYTFFMMGIIWTAFGIIFKDMSFFFIVGLAFMTIGLVNKDKWKKNHRAWKQLTKEERKFKTTIIIALGILVFLGLLAYLFFI